MTTEEVLRKADFRVSINLHWTFINSLSTITVLRENECDPFLMGKQRQFRGLPFCVEWMGFLPHNPFLIGECFPTSMKMPFYSWIWGPWNHPKQTLKSDQADFWTTPYPHKDHPHRMWPNCQAVEIHLCVCDQVCTIDEVLGSCPCENSICINPKHQTVFCLIYFFIMCFHHSSIFKKLNEYHHNN